MEPIAHIEWSLGFVLIILGVMDIFVSGFHLFLVVLGVSAPDLIDLFVFGSKEKFSLQHRIFSHNIFLIIFLGLIVGITALISSSLGSYPLFFLFGAVLHIIEDIGAGGDSIRLFAPFSTWELPIQANKLNERIGKAWKNFASSYIGTDSLGDRLAWQWFLTTTGSLWFLTGILLYLA